MADLDRASDHCLLKLPLLAAAVVAASGLNDPFWRCAIRLVNDFPLASTAENVGRKMKFRDFGAKQLLKHVYLIYQSTKN
ncbi:hypothetical protein ACJIZ3_012903 [Penstemon smallii]|uniref:Uncharacterized protein n=1 Tax=Penstemon smallii TaxID=265156 RepID=A0ABD3UPX9_9LAMI